MADNDAGTTRKAGASGRRLDETRDPVILRAALEGVAEVGYDRLTMDDIAARARAGKGALYRRWPSKAALIIDAIAAWRQELAPRELPDTGSLRGDLDMLVAGVPDSDDDSQRMALVVSGLATAARRDPELSSALSGPILEVPLALMRGIFEKAVARGEIPPERDLDLMAETAIALNVFRMVMKGEVPDRAFVRRVVDEILYPLLTAPVAASRVPAAKARLRDRTLRPDREGSVPGGPVGRPCSPGWIGHGTQPPRASR
jgi:AcrR family transcriptional regulator